MDIFLIEDLPFDELEKIGISKKSFLNLPIDALDKLMTGRLSPLFKLRMNLEDHIVDFYAKIAFERDKTDKAVLKVYPIRKDIDDTIPLTKEELEDLQQGFVIKKNIDKDGKKIPSLLQLDLEINTLMSTALRNLYIPKTIGNKFLTKEQSDLLKAGKTIEITNNQDIKITVGVDLHSKAGIKTVNGDLAKWREEQLIKWDIANPGIKGYWITSENNWQYLEYKNKEQLTEDTNMKIKR